MRLAVIGGGAWGTALAQVAARGGEPVTLWAREDDVVASVNATQENALFLPGVPLSRAIRATGAALHWAIDDPKELERQVPRLTFVAEIAGADFEDLARAPWPMQMLARCFGAIPILRRIGRMLRYRF